jgi:hypothetical protein
MAKQDKATKPAVKVTKKVLKGSSKVGDAKLMILVV